MDWLVKWGLERRVLGPISAIGADEISYNRGHHYLTLVYQPVKSFRRFFDV